MAVVDLIAGYLGDYWFFHSKGGSNKRTIALIEDKHDIVVFGSSRAHHHYDAPLMSEMLDLDVYNAGYNGNGVVLAYGLLELVIENYKPELVIYDVEPSFDINIYLPDNHHIRYIDGLKPFYTHESIKEIIKGISKEEWHKVHSGLLRYNSNLINALGCYIWSNSIIMRGYEPLGGQLRGELGIDTTIDNTDDFKLGYLQKMIYLCKQHNIPIIFISSPRYALGASNVLSPVKQLCESSDVLFLDYSEDTVFLNHKEWFRDINHLNSVGAKIYSEKVVGDVKDCINK